MWICQGSHWLDKLLSGSRIKLGCTVHWIAVPMLPGATVRNDSLVTWWGRWYAWWGRYGIPQVCLVGNKASQLTSALHPTTEIFWMGVITWLMQKSGNRNGILKLQARPHQTAFLGIQHRSTAHKFCSTAHPVWCYSSVESKGAKEWEGLMFLLVTRKCLQQLQGEAGQSWHVREDSC